MNILLLNEDILMTYGDGLSNIPINKLVKFHYSNQSINLIYKICNYIYISSHIYKSS